MKMLFLIIFYPILGINKFQNNIFIIIFIILLYLFIIIFIYYPNNYMIIDDLCINKTFFLLNDEFMINFLSVGRIALLYYMTMFLFLPKN